MFGELEILSITTPVPKTKEEVKPPPPSALPSHVQNTQPLASPSYSFTPGKTVCLHCPGASRAFGEREAGQPSDQTQRLVKRQKQLKVFMNNAGPTPPPVPPTPQLSVVQARINALPLGYAARLSQNFTERPRRKAPTIRGRLSENINAFLSQPVRPAADTNRHGELSLHPMKAPASQRNRDLKAKGEGACLSVVSVVLGCEEMAPASSS